MAKRPIFIPQSEGQKLVLEKMIEFTWNPGFAPIQKKKNIVALHAAADEKKISPLLEVSTTQMYNFLFNTVSEASKLILKAR